MCFRPTVIIATTALILAVVALGTIAPASTAKAAERSALPTGFSRLSTVAPAVLQEMRYHGSHNFMGRPVDGYDAPECWLTRRAALALRRVQRRVNSLGYTLKVYDCYRPQRAVSAFYRWAQDPSDDTMRAEFYPTLAKDTLFPLGYIAEKSGHSRGSTVDLTLVPRGRGVSPRWRPGTPLVACTEPVARRFADTSIDMGTGYDCFDPLANTANSTITPVQAANRAILVNEMTRAGFTNLPEEWWHYTLAAEPFPTTYFNAPIRRR
jgi:D-alanyl-D-alanine dipeptidase